VSVSVSVSVSWMHATRPHHTGYYAWMLVTEWCLVHGPHVHGNRPIWLYDLFPNSRKNNLAIGADQIIVSFLHVRPNHVNVEESLLDQLVHALYWIVSLETVSHNEPVDIPARFGKGGKGS